MAKRSKRSRSTEFSAKAREEIKARDGNNCIFCVMRYQMEKADPYEQSIKEIMHYIPRSAGGLGIAQNAAIGCKYHHMMLDNGNQGNREEMLGLFREYLSKRYRGWNEKELVYDKWSFLKGEER